MFLFDHLAPHIRFGEVGVRGAQPDFSGISPEYPYFGRRQFGRRRWDGQNLDMRLVNTGLLLAVGIPLNNSSEGIAVGAGYPQNPQFGLFIALAIMLYNIQ